MVKVGGIMGVMALLMLGACSGESISSAFMSSEPEILAETESGKLLRGLPAAKRKAVVAVYDFEDQTGQHKPNDRLAEFSRAVTQGGAAIVTEALTKAGKGTWFRVIERKGLDHLLRERQIIAATREQYTTAGAKLPPMLYAGLLLEGGIVSYESNTVTGGLGARYLGIGGTTEYRQDVVTVYLRAVNVQNGEVLLSTNASKTIFSTALGGSVFKFVAFDEVLEIESGFTVNEPPQFAVRQAIESAVYSLIMEGAIQELWEFAEPTAGRLEVQRYYARVYGKPLPKTRDVQPVKLERSVQEPAALHAPRKIMDNNVSAAPVAPVMVAPVPVAPVPQRSVVMEQENAEPVDTAPAQVTPSAAPRQTLPHTLQVPASQQGKPKYHPPSRYEEPVKNGAKTKLYCTPAGCYPFPPDQQ